MGSTAESDVTIPVDDVALEGYLGIPDDADGIVVFAHGSGSSRDSPRNTFVADRLQRRGLATLLFDLLTVEEDRHRESRFDIDRLTDRLVGATEWLTAREDTRALGVGYFGSSTGAAAALRAAAESETDVRAVVSRGGRVDLAFDVLPQVTAATLFIVGGEDTTVLRLNREAMESLPEPKSLAVVERAGHLFEGPGELERVAELAGNWFEEHLTSETGRPDG